MTGAAAGVDGAAERVELWLLDVRGPVPGLESARIDDLLDEKERTRAAAFVRESDRVLYRVAHAALRAVLAARTGLSPAAVRFTREPCPCCGEAHGRPRLEAPGGPQFSLSHGGDLVLIGLAAATAPIGVDVEPLPSPQATRELATVLHPLEQAELTARSGGANPTPAAFAQLWTRKEAYLKGLGTGLGRDPAEDYTGEANPGALPPGWTLANIPAGPTHAAALAVLAPTATFTLHTSLLDSA
ncbi:4'-phosphopantetheinyl transferase [Streptacidiphilus sp. MAP12-20]|uniref:4'-phosphopantetheinyl transferase family protein n=1 Tax=Streptacidiphilus sp. MAP12-20 TaxID=3156299 RepID=UPI003518209E